jgi:UDP-2-acetamido-3-amino-2,3-dideoxy-glucuronate N-acetyltransferase
MDPAAEDAGRRDPPVSASIHPSATVHSTAVVDPGVSLGADTRVWHFAHVCGGARIGSDCVLGQGVYVGPDVRIGRGCKIQNHVSVYAGVVLEDEVFVGPSAVFTNVRTPRAHVDRREAFSPTRVGRRATIGANATVVCGTTVGAAAFVAAGAVVTRDVPPHTLVQGCPARPVGFYCDCGERLPEPTAAAEPLVWACGACPATYVRRAGGGLEPRSP